jgi:polyhydroxyalkanoate synthesis repressor PhaR
VNQRAAEPRLIRRYANRKLYDVRASAYVALEDLGAMVRGGEELRVVDTATGDDITAQTLTQVILDEGKRGHSLLPTDLLHAALRRGGRALDAGRGAVETAVGAVGTIRHAADDLLHHSIGRLARVLPGPHTDELDALRRQMADMERTLAALVAQQPAATTPPTPPGDAPTPSDPDPSS